MSDILCSVPPALPTHRHVARARLRNTTKTKRAIELAFERQACRAVYPTVRPQPSSVQPEKETGRKPFGSHSRTSTGDHRPLIYRTVRQVPRTITSLVPAHDRPARSTSLRANNQRHNSVNTDDAESMPTATKRKTSPPSPTRRSVAYAYIA